MPTFTGKTFASFYKNLLGINQTSNTGVNATTRRVQDGAGNNSAISLSDDVLSVQPVNDDTISLLVKSKGGSNILQVDTDNKLVRAGASQINCLTLYKEMGLYSFTPVADVHYPLVANRVGDFEVAFTAVTDFGTGTDPAATLDVSAMTLQHRCVAMYWLLDNNITLDRVSYTVHTDQSDVLKMHLEAYTLDGSTGDLSAGATYAHLHNLSTVNTIVYTGEVPIDTANIDSGKVVIGFIESDSTTDLSIHYNIKYHIR